VAIRNGDAAFPDIGQMVHDRLPTLLPCPTPTAVPFRDFRQTLGNTERDPVARAATVSANGRNGA